MLEYMDPSDGDLLNYVALENEAVMTAFYASRNTYQLASPLVEPPQRVLPSYKTSRRKRLPT
jgi:hypothetical protein